MNGRVNSLDPFDLTDEIILNITTLIKKAESEKCQITKVEVSTPILHTVSNQYVLAIPANRKLKAHKSCENNEIIIIENPSLINIPLNCGLSIEQTKFWNYKKVLKGSPFFLPPLKFINLNLSKLNQNLI